MPTTLSKTFRSLDGLQLEAKVTAPDSIPSGDILLVHGITATMDEGGMYARLAEDLAVNGFRSTRFSFRGHGYSEGGQESVTIAGELTDLISVVQEVRPLHAIVASSFGAVSAIRLLKSMPDVATRLVLWNPVLSLLDTFLDPSLPWGRANFGRARIRAALEGSGVLSVDADFDLTATLFLEMEHYDIESCFADLRLQTMIIHGTADAYVSFDVAARACANSAHATLVSIEGADHGFDRPEEEELVRRATIDFLTTT